MKTLLLGAALAALATPAFSTEWLYCSNTGNVAQVGLLFGSLGISTASAITLTDGTSQWSSAEVYGPGDPITLGQAFEDADTIRVDLVDDQYGKIATLRLFKQDTPDAYVLGGVLTIGDKAFVVGCEY